MQSNLSYYKSLVETALDKILPEEQISYGVSHNLYEAMRYSILSPKSKRIRAALIFATGHALGVDPQKLIGAAASLEMVHAYSLIHDDLPAMDDDDFRRGQPTCHKQFNESTAILAGDALLTMAFEVLSDPKWVNVSSKQRIEMVLALSKASGPNGMILGQSLDIAATNNNNISKEQLQNIHSYKTGKLVDAAVKIGTLFVKDLNPNTVKKLLEFANNLGLAFQIKDDVLDLEENTEVLGKPAMSDIEKNKSTYPKYVGIEQAKKITIELYNNAINSIRFIGERSLPLQELADYVVNRNY